MSGRAHRDQAADTSADARIQPFNVDDLFDIYNRVTGAFACICGLQLWAEVEVLEPNALEPLAAVLQPARDRLDELVKAAKEAGEL